MLHVLRHYLPLRKVILIVSETVLLTVVLAAGMSAHLWVASNDTIRELAWRGMHPADARWQIVASSFLVAAIAQIIIALNELYDFRVSSSRYERAARFLGSAGIAIVISAVVVALSKLWNIQGVFDFPGLPLSQAIVLLVSSMAVGFTLLYLWRHLFHLLLRRSHFDERILILGAGRFARRLVDELMGRQNSGYEIVGMLPLEGGDRRSGHQRRRASDRAGDRERTGNPWFEAVRSESPPVEGTLAARADAGGQLLLVSEGQTEPKLSGVPAHEPVDRLANKLNVDTVVVALEERRGSLPADELLKCRLDGVTVIEAEAFFEKLTGKIPAEGMRPSYLIFNPGFLQHPLAEAAKRGVDIALALVGLLLLWPVMLATALLIRWDSPGSVFFRQERVGRLGRPFVLCKFRSMRQDAEKNTGPVWAQENDPRITRVGKFLRRTRLDELPQLFNVLGGSMSLVGPRPERPHFVAELSETIPYYPQRHIVKPGVTGWAQINYPYGNTLEDSLQKLQYDLFYIKYQSTLFDLSIVFNTVKTVLLRKGT